MEGLGEAATDAVWYDIKEKAGATDFLGYDTETAEGVIAAIVAKGHEVDRARSGRRRGADP